MIDKKGPAYIIGSNKGYLQILFYAENIIRFAYSENADLPPSTAAVIGKPLELEGRIASGRLLAGNFQIEVDRETLTVTIYSQEGLLLSEDRSVSLVKPGLEKKKLWEVGIYGNGEKYTWLNQLGSATANYNSDVLFHNPIHHPQVEEMHTAIPFYIGVAPAMACGLYFDNSFKTSFDFARSNLETISFKAEGGYLDYYFIYSPSVAGVLKAYAALTGSPPLPRKKYLGFQQSRYSYETREELLAVARNMRLHKIPCDVLYLDIGYLDAYKVFTVNKERFGDLKALLQELKELGFAVVVIINPGVKVEPGYRVYEDGQDKGFFVTGPDGNIYEGEVWPKPAAFPDFLRSDVRKWWGQFHRELLDCGVDGIWNDMNEPANFTETSGTLPDDVVHHDDSGRSVSHSEAHNLYGFMQTRATREALESLQPEKRPFVLTRAAFAGSQRYAALWTGDNSSVWEHLECSIPMCLNLGLSGFSFVGADVGGYRGDCSAELMVRWTQLAAFIPFFRNHSEIDTAHQEPWEYGPEILSILRRYIMLRYSFLTYFYNLMRISSLHGEPAIRPLFYHHGDELETYHIYDQFLCGQGLMVCPVTRPGANHRQVYLPRGTWFDYWTQDKLAGGSYHLVEAPLAKLPLFVKAGSILPVDQFTISEKTGFRATGLEMHCYAGDDGFFRLYLDDGATANHLRGEYSEIDYSFKDDPVRPKIEINRIKEQYPIPQISTKIIGINNSADCSEDC
jgi:alpha-glucosidase